MDGGQKGENQVGETAGPEKKGGEQGWRVRVQRGRGVTGARRGEKEQEGKLGFGDKGQMRPVDTPRHFLGPALSSAGLGAVLGVPAGQPLGQGCECLCTHLGM